MAFSTETVERATGSSDDLARSDRSRAETLVWGGLYGLLSVVLTGLVVLAVVDLTTAAYPVVRASSLLVAGAMLVFAPAVALAAGLLLARTAVRALYARTEARRRLRPGRPATDPPEGSPAAVERAGTRRN